MTDRSIAEGKCFQCGRSEFVLTEEENAKGGWIICGYCGERIIQISELAEMARTEAIERAKRNLGVDEFLKSRKID